MSCSSQRHQPNYNAKRRRLVLGHHEFQRRQSFNWDPTFDIMKESDVALLRQQRGHMAMPADGRNVVNAGVQKLRGAQHVHERVSGPGLLSWENTSNRGFDRPSQDAGRTAAEAAQIHVHAHAAHPKLLHAAFTTYDRSAGHRQYGHAVAAIRPHRTPHDVKRRIPIGTIASAEIHGAPSTRRRRWHCSSGWCRWRRGRTSALSSVYIRQAMVSWRLPFMHWTACAFSLARVRAGKSSAARTAMMAIDDNSSMSVNPRAGHARMLGIRAGCSCFHE